MSKSENRQKSQLIQVRATPEEKAKIVKQAEAFGVSVGELCRMMIFKSRPPKAVLDQGAIIELAKLRGDLGRVGGLLKGWLAGAFVETAGLPDKGEVPRVRDLLKQIEERQAQIMLQLSVAFGESENDKQADS